MVTSGEKSRRTQAERRARVLCSAEELFLARGFHECSMAAIAEHSGVHVAQIYRDFTSKEGLVEASVRTGLGTVIASVGEAVRAPDIRSSLHHWLRATVDSAPRPGPWQLISEISAEAIRNPAIARILRQEELSARLALTDLLAERLGSSHSPSRLRAIAEFLLTLNLGIFVRNTLVPATDPEGLADVAEEALMAILHPSAPPPPGSSECCPA